MSSVTYNGIAQQSVFQVPFVVTGISDLTVTVDGASAPFSYANNFVTLNTPLAAGYHWVTITSTYVPGEGGLNGGGSGGSATLVASKNAGATDSNTLRVVTASDDAVLGILGKTTDAIPADSSVASSVYGELKLINRHMEDPTPAGVYPMPALPVSGTTAQITDLNDHLVLAAPAAGLRNYITGVVISNAHATVGTEVVLKDGASGTVLATFPAASAYGGVALAFPTPLKQPTTATAIYAADLTTGAAVKVTLNGFQAA